MQRLGVCPMVVRGVDLGDIIEVIFMYSSKPNGISHLFPFYSNANTCRTFNKQMAATHFAAPGLGLYFLPMSHN